MGKNFVIKIAFIYTEIYYYILSTEGCNNNNNNRQKI